MDQAFEVLCKNSQDPRSTRFSPVLSFRSFIVLHFTFGSMINFELIFVEGIKSLSRIIFLHVDVQLSQRHVLKRLSFFH